MRASTDAVSCSLFSGNRGYSRNLHVFRKNTQ